MLVVEVVLNVKNHKKMKIAISLPTLKNPDFFEKADYLWLLQVLKHKLAEEDLLDMEAYLLLLRSRSGSRGVSIGSRGYSGSPVGYGYYLLKGLGKLWRLIYSIQKVHGKMPRYHNFVCRIQMYC